MARLNYVITSLCRGIKQAWGRGLGISLIACHLIANGVSQGLDWKVPSQLLDQASHMASRPGGLTPAEIGRQHGIPPELHALIYSGGDNATLSPLGCRTLSYVYGCLGHGPFCNGEWCGKPENEQKCNSLIQAGLNDRTKFMETESASRVLSSTSAKGYTNLAENEGVLNVMTFLCEPTEVPWWPADPLAGPSPSRISDGPASRLARELSGKTMLMIGDSIMEQTCGAILCAMRRDSSLRARPSPRIAEWEREAHATLSGSVRASWEAEATGFTLLCWRMDQYNNRTLNSEARYRRLLAASQPDVLVVNHGAHGGDDIEAYANNMQELFNLVKGLGYSPPEPAAKGGGNEKVFLWSTTTAQHFDTPTGDFDRKTQKQQSCYCAEAKKGIHTISEKQALKTIDLSKAAGFGPPLEMYWLTHGRSHLHLEECRNFMLRNPNSQECGPRLDHNICDCTHLCYSPAFFDTVTQRLRAKLIGAPRFLAAAARESPGPRRSRGHHLKRQRTGGNS